MRFKGTDPLTIERLREFVAAGIRETRDLELKRDLTATSDSDKREFAADVSALANSEGGHIFYGIDESEGLATAICGISVDDPDALILRLSSILATGIEPRVAGVVLEWFTDGNVSVLGIEVPRSWAGPHRITATHRFFARNSAGKYPMDVGELRRAFLGRDQVGTYLRRFRDTRLGEIEGQAGPVLTPPVPRLVLHLMPLSAASLSRDFADYGDLVWVPPLESFGGYNMRYCLEGFATPSVEDNGVAQSYSLLWRNGVIEGVTTLGRQEDGQTWVFLQEAGQIIRSGIEIYRNRLRALDMDYPFVAFVSCVTVGGTRHYDRGPFASRRSSSFRRPTLLVPDVLIGSNEDDLDLTLDPVIKTLWNAYGYPGPPT